ncbi:MAG TPA: nucleotidyltransferase domain-containing protein [Leptospiraceae bacterium]|nr:nucleotidyltransferase domain-containing protein [Leptospiraceae bacterium]HMW05933.1 nucleotidyltransferase domain-containing protein [Leptospiraceae bacterium]HMX34555.1 nucleotidyltransferase domain-containing protein [Leptospiraceae bacterium]HMY32287.1 nucleotidyltransferase domain-containing protein [Leptospiraceae bacterium]HMZ62511.1 nucleotidyltransferase domain-containing protein [Leptospiraceae bacterium]
MINQAITLNDETVIKFKNLVYKLEAPVNRIYLFGSRAKGNQSLESDYDFLVLLNNINDGELMKKYRRTIVLNAHKEIPDVPFDILVKNLEEFEAYKMQMNTLYNEIFKDGIEI